MLRCRVRFGPHLMGRGWGFGNRLFPWARARIFCHLHDARMIDPVWVRPALGQAWRGGIDYPSYLRQLVLWRLFKHREDDIGTVENLVKFGRSKILNERDFGKSEINVPDSPDDVVVEFNGLESYFAPLNGWSDFLLRELRTITRRKYLDLADSVGEVPIGICVRCGNDVPEPKLESATLQWGEKTPVRWFVDSLNAVRDVVGHPVRAFVVSDGTRRQLRELLEMEEVVFVRPGSAISDLLITAKARVLLASGSSSFAAWAGFLGQMPAISHPGQPLTNWGMTNDRGKFIGEFHPAEPAEEFLVQAAGALGQPLIEHQ